MILILVPVITPCPVILFTVPRPGVHWNVGIIEDSCGIPVYAIYGLMYIGLLHVRSNTYVNIRIREKYTFSE